MAQLMVDFAAGRTGPKDHKRLRDGVEELRLAGDRRAIRLYFGRCDDDDGFVLVAVHIQVKKVDNDRRAVDLAVRRWRDYQAGRWGN